MSRMGGPLSGAVIRLDRYGDLKTLPFSLRGQVGRYIGPDWYPVALARAA